MATIRFYGDLQRFGRRFTLDVTTASEAIRALCIQIPGLRQHLEHGHYRLRISRQDISETNLNDQLSNPVSHNTAIHLVPVIGAAKSRYLSIITGAVLVAASFFAGPAGPGMLAAGIGMMASGVATLLTPIPQVDTGKGANNGAANKYFNSLGNSLAQGSCVPLIYGEVMTGSKVLSQGLRTV
ncbi:tail assembly protein [Photobacterium sp. 1_MG-2023]|uniref:tail assembly protein n=1 Tax=Photobacterium sp. 1_MG-2023 TaxID=3062646 RepID=UPI0026E201DD|nr:tail assembly protein [Photobacterium sp. 1_MG-2023]MDO6706797.1 tail assembly protein [Photobacterium sp. 1_MG-2023]